MEKSRGRVRRHENLQSIRSIEIEARPQHIGSTYSFIINLHSTSLPFNRKVPLRDMFQILIT